MKITVFIADDHNIVVSGLTALLEIETDIKVVGTAVNGLEAEKQIIKLSPQIAILDINMPEMNGIAAARRIADYCASTKVIILSMHKESEYVIRALDAGVQGYLLKETAGEEIVEAIRRVSAGGQYLSEKISHLGDKSAANPNRAERSPLEKLSQRECEVLQQLAEGKTNAEIGKNIGISPTTVDTYMTRMKGKLEEFNIKTRTDLIKFAIKHGLTTLDQ